MKSCSAPPTLLLVLAAMAGQLSADNLPAPDVHLKDGEFLFTLPASVAERTYQLQYADDAAAGPWRDIESVRATDSTGVQITSRLPSGVSRRFYRIAAAGPNEWRAISASGPSAGGIAAYDSDRHVAVMFACEGSYPNDTWEFDGAQWRRIAVPGTLPHGRDGSGKMVYDTVYRRMILAGGWWPDDNDPWTWQYRVTGPGPDDRAWSPVVSASPAFRGAPALAWDSKRHTALHFGGNRYQSFYNDTWRFDPAENAWTSLVSWGPSRFAAGLVYDSARDRFVLFGGTGRWWAGDTEQGRGNTCEFNPATGDWTEILPQGAPGTPGPRWFPRMIYDAAAGVTILKGGSRPSDGYGYTDTWEWDGTQWRQMPTPPVDPTGGVMWYDTSRQRPVLYSAPHTWVYYR